MGMSQASASLAIHDLSPAAPEKILVVDDSAENLISIEAALEGLGQEVVTARSGQEALRHLLESNFALILLDVKMPGMDGFQTAELIRARKRSLHTPILFLTAYRSDDHLFRGYDMGAVDFLIKPIVPEILRSKVSVFVELSRHAALLRRQAEVLAKAERRFRSLLEAAPDAMIISSESGRIYLVNSQAEILTGYGRDELINESIQLVVPDWEVDLLSAGPTSANQHFARRKDSTTVPVEISLRPLQTEEGLLAISAIRDVTERNRLNNELRELNSSLEKRVAERTKELEESNKALRLSNDDLNQFAYATSHDLQEPLRMVVLYSQMLQDAYAGKLDESADQFISFIVNGGLRLEGLLRDLLAYSQAGSSPGSSMPVDCMAVMQEVLLNLKVSIDENEATIQICELPTIQGERIRLIQLVQNLIGNAIKYRNPEAPYIEVRAERRDKEWLFAVQDNGIGIAPEYKEQVFGVFKRLHGPAYHGTGIGLAICQRIVETHGGRIWVESLPGKGSTFYFTMPATDKRSS